MAFPASVGRAPASAASCPSTSASTNADLDIHNLSLRDFYCLLVLRVALSIQRLRGILEFCQTDCKHQFAQPTGSNFRTCSYILVWSRPVSRALSIPPASKRCTCGVALIVCSYFQSSRYKITPSENNKTIWANDVIELFEDKLR